MKDRFESSLLILRSHIRKGRLFEAQKMLAKGSPAFLPNTKQQPLLMVAVESGFHSMVQILLEFWNDEETFYRAAERAMEKHRGDIVRLFLDKGLEIDRISFQTVAECYDRDLIIHLFNNWDQYDREDGLAEIILSRIKYFIGVIKKYAPTLPNYNVQMARALRYFIDMDDIKWVSLCLWMGADPLLPVLAIPIYGESEEDEIPENALTDIIRSCSLEMYKAAQIKKYKNELLKMELNLFAFRSESYLAFKYLLGLGLPINDKKDGTSSILTAMLLKYMNVQYPASDRYTNEELLFIEELIAEGAKANLEFERYYRPNLYLQVSLLSKNKAIAFLKKTSPCTR